MAQLEIERKFLVQGEGWRVAAPERLRQGYLNRDPQRTVRVRLLETAGIKLAFLTIKGQTSGISRAEFEYEIPVADAQALLALCDGPLIEKARHRLPLHDGSGRCWEVDEFFGANAGLVVAEIELQQADQAFERPDWLGPEVSHDARYFNSSLSRRPFAEWRDEPPVSPAPVR